MANPDWGTKRVCQACATKYYDLKREPIVCPSCGVEFDPEALLKSRRSRSTAKAEKEPVKKLAPVGPDEEPDAAEDDDDETKAAADVEVESDDTDDSEDEESVIEDVSDLGDDDLDEVVVKDDGDEAER